MPTHPIWSTAKGRLKDHQDRESQDILFTDVLNRFAKGEHIVPTEGHTGVGKSLIVAPMVASLPKPVRILDGEYETKPRVVISAFTKAQQRTIHDETFPRIEPLLDRGFAVLYGRANYLCLDRANVAMINAKVVGDGSRAHYPQFSNTEWQQICSSPEDGCDRRCAEDTYQVAKERAKEASVLMVNHSLLALNHELEGVIFGRLGDTTLVVDEAHLLPNALRSAYGVDLSPVRFSQVGSALVKAGWNRTTVDIAKQIFTDALSRYRVDGQSWVSQQAAIDCRAKMTDEYEVVASVVEGGDASRDQKAAYRRFGNLMNALRVIADDSGDYAAWVTLTGRAKVETQPFEVHEQAGELFRSADRTVVMSATMEPLATKLLGLDMRVTVSPQPFDLANRRLGYVSSRKVLDNEPHQWDEDELVALVRTANVGTLVVASSNVQKDRAAAALAFAGFRVGVQKDTAGVPDLLEDLKQGRVDVLCGVDSLGTGIDVPGDALRLVVLLSSLNPNAFTNPYLRLTSERLGKSRAWRELFGPMATEKTWQTIGRLIRTPSDYGVVAFLDPRPREISKFVGMLKMDGTLTTNCLQDVEEHLGRFA